MSVLETTLFTAGGTVDNGWYGRRKAGSIRERVSAASNSPSITLTKQLPPGARIVHAAIKNSSASTPRLASTAAATEGQAGLALVFTAPTSLATGSTTSNVLIHGIQTAFGASVSSNTLAQGLAPVAATAGGISTYPAYQNTGTTAVNLHIVPYASTTGATNATQRYLVNTTTATSGYTINGTSTTVVSFDVEVFYEEYSAPVDR